MIEEKIIPKGYKSSALGVIPQDWEVMNFDEVAEIDRDSLKSNTDKSYKFEYISLSDVDSNEFSIKSTIQVFGTAPSRARRIVKKGDVLMSTVRPNLQGFLFIRDDVKKVIASTGFAVISPKICNNEFIYHYLFSDYISKQFYQLLVGSNYPAINSSDVRKLKIVFPLDLEQKAIADCLSTWDRAIEKLNQLIAQKELCKKGLMQELLSGKKRLRGFEGEWLENYMGEITENFSRRNKTTIDARVFSVTNKNGFVLQSDHFEREIAGDDLSNYKIIKKDEFAYNPARINVGSIAFFKEEIGIISSLYVCFKTNGLVRNNYLLQLLNVDYMKHKFNAYGEGGVRVYLWYELFSKIKLLVPPIDEQDEILGVLEKADDEIQLLKNKLELLKMQKKGLMQVLLTGKKRLKY